MLRPDLLRGFPSFWAGIISPWNFGKPQNKSVRRICSGSKCCAQICSGVCQISGRGLLSERQICSGSKCCAQICSGVFQISERESFILGILDTPEQIWAPNLLRQQMLRPDLLRDFPNFWVGIIITGILRNPRSNLKANFAPGSNFAPRFAPREKTDRFSDRQSSTSTSVTSTVFNL